MDAMEFLARERQAEFLRQADRERLARRALEGREPTFRPLLHKAGGALVRLGQSLQRTAERPRAHTPFRIVKNHV